jgi:hypothetical protein
MFAYSLVNHITGGDKWKRVQLVPIPMDAAWNDLYFPRFFSLAS